MQPLRAGKLLALAGMLTVSLAASGSAQADPVPTPSPSPSVTASADPTGPGGGGGLTGTGAEPPPGPATGPPSIAPSSQVAGSGRPLKVVETPSTARPVSPVRLAAAGSLAAPAAPPPATGWITSAAWNVAPQAGTAPPTLPVFARDVVLTQGVSAATLTVAGLGLYAPTVNGRPASTAVLQPGPSDFSKSVEYRSYDVTALLGHGTNRLGVALGAGIYDEVSLPNRYSKLTHIGGPLGFTARLDLTLADGSRSAVDTSSNWWTRPGGTTVSDWYGGESYNAATAPTGWSEASSPLRADAGWAPAVTANISPQLTLHPQTVPPATAGSPVTAASATRLTSGDWVIDYGRYVTGQPQLRLSAPQGRVVRLYPAERLAGGVPDQSTSTGGKPLPIFDEYTFAGSGVETWNPQFVYHGFRYLRVTGAADLSLTPTAFAVVPVSTRLPRQGTSSSSDATFNSIVALTETAMTANFQSILTDCPNREKLGWLEQSHLLFGLFSGRYDMSVYGPNLVRLMLEAQHADGSMPEIAPEMIRFWSPFDADVHWGGALVMLPWQLYRTYGDTGTLSQAYSAMVRYVQNLQSRASGNLIDFGLGDWLTPARGAQRGLTTSMGYYSVVTTLAKVARVLGKSTDASADDALAAQIRTAINAKYYRDHMYGSEQATNAMALVLGVAPDETAVRGSLVSLMTASGNHFLMGEVGLSYLFTALHEMGRDDLLWSAIMQQTAPGYAAFVTSGAPALPEYWSGMSGTGSLAHFMLGYPAKWAQDGLAGIDQAPDSVGYRQLVIRPAVFTGPASVSATRPTALGDVTVQWTRASGSAHVVVTLPAGAQASVVLPNGVHSATAGTTSYDTGLGTRSDYGAKPFLVPTGTIYRVPWNGALWAMINGVPVHLIWAQWQATGFRTPVTGLPPGSIVAHAPWGTALLARTPDGEIHQLTYTEWGQIGYPQPVTLPHLVSKYQWSPSIWLTTKWTTDPTSWVVVHLTSADYTALGRPVPVDTVVTPHSLVYKYATSPVIYVRDPDGQVHALTYAEWGHLGYPKPTIV
jgi:hypothetical protein